MIRFNKQHSGFTVGKLYDAKYAMHPFYDRIVLRVTDDYGYVRYINPYLVEIGKISEVDEEGEE